MARQFDESKVVRWPEGTKEEPGKGGGKFMSPKNGPAAPAPSGPAAPAEKPHSRKLQPSKEKLDDARRTADRWRKKLNDAALTAEQRAKAEYEANYWDAKAARIEKALGEGKARSIDEIEAEIRQVRELIKRTQTEMKGELEALDKRRGDLAQELIRANREAEKAPKPDPAPKPEPKPEPKRYEMTAEDEAEFRRLDSLLEVENDRGKRAELERQMDDIVSGKRPAKPEPKPEPPKPKFDAEEARRKRQEEQDRRRYAEDLARRVEEARKPSDPVAGMKKERDDLVAQIDKLKAEIPKGDRFGNMGSGARRVADRMYREMNTLDRKRQELERTIYREDPARAEDRITDTIREAYPEEQMRYAPLAGEVADLIRSELDRGQVEDGYITIAPPSGWEVSIKETDARQFLDQSRRRSAVEVDNEFARLAAGMNCGPNGVLDYGKKFPKKQEHRYS